MDDRAAFMVGAMAGSVFWFLLIVGGVIVCRRLLSSRLFALGMLSPETLAPMSPGGEVDPGGARGSGRQAPVVQQAYRVIVVLDLERFSRKRWDDQLRVRSMRALREALTDAFGIDGIAREQWVADTTGDGLLVFVEPEVGTANVVCAVRDRLPAVLALHNRLMVPGARLRARAVVHAGHVMFDDRAGVGEQVIHAFRLMDADGLRQRLRRARSPLVVAVSEHVFEQVVRHRPLGLNPDDYEEVPVEVKETSAVMWVHAAGATERSERELERPVEWMLADPAFDADRRARRPA